MFLKYDVGEGNIQYKLGKVGVVDTEDSVVESVSPAFLKKYAMDSGTQAILEIGGNPFSFEFRLAAVQAQLVKYTLLHKPYEFYQYNVKAGKAALPFHVRDAVKNVNISAADIASNKPLLTFVDTFTDEKTIRVPWGIDVMLLTKPVPNADVLTMPATVKYFSINQSNRTMLPNVTKVQFDDCNLKVYKMKLGKGAFGNMANLRTVSLSNAVQVISSYCFLNCGNLVDVSIPDSVQKIGVEAFSCCTSLSDLKLPPYLTKLSSSFIKHTKITKLSLPDALVDFYAAFEGSSVRYLSMTEPSFYAYYDRYYNKNKYNLVSLLPTTLRSLDIRKVTRQVKQAWGKTQIPKKASSPIQLSNLVSMCQLDSISAPASFIDTSIFDSASQHLFTNGLFRWRNNEG